MKSNLKIAIITANIGGIDPILGIPKQTIPYDYYYYDETNLPFPLVNLDNRMKAKYCKLQAHRFLPEYDAYIWIDGRIKIEGINFTENFIEQLGKNNLAIYKHRERSNVYEEIEYILDQLKQGNQYLLSRYNNSQLVKELLFYKDQGLKKNYPLFMAGVFCRLNNKETNECFDEWWKMCLEFSCFDQALLSYVTWKHDLKISAIAYDELRTHKLFKITEHL